QVVTWRNAVDHPNDETGELRTTNFTVESRNGELFLVPPKWGHSGDAKQIPVVESMDQIVELTLVMYEDVFAQLFYKLKVPFPVVLLEIPEGERKPEAPIRLYVGLPQDAQPDESPNGRR